jgi:hypothetical protein
MLQTTIGCALLCLAILQLAIRSPLPVDITTDYLLFQLSALLCLAILQPTILYALPSLLILQPTISLTDYPLCSVLRYYNRLSYVLYSVW